MNSAKLKSDLISAIIATKDPVILQEMRKLMELDTEDISKIVLSGDQKRQLMQAVRQIEGGQFLTHQEAKVQAEAWLKE